MQTYLTQLWRLAKATSVACDTCASINVGHLGFHLSVAETLPHLVKSLIWAKDEHTPITLSGIVSDASDKNTAKPTSVPPAIIEMEWKQDRREKTEKGQTKNEKKRFTPPKCSRRLVRPQRFFPCVVSLNMMHPHLIALTHIAN
jgi:hypothetical protein